MVWERSIVLWYVRVERQAHAHGLVSGTHVLHRGCVVSMLLIYGIVLMVDRGCAMSRNIIKDKSEWVGISSDDIILKYTELLSVCVCMYMYVCMYV